ncbi:hypothetical protein COEREDRAFT_65458, partial [Coemansia reversa NRRL 1564]
MNDIRQRFKRNSRGKETEQTIGISTLKIYGAAITDLYKTQVCLGTNTNKPPGEALKGIIDCEERKQNEQRIKRDTDFIESIFRDKQHNISTCSEENNLPELIFRHQIAPITAEQISTNGNEDDIQLGQINDGICKLQNEIAKLNDKLSRVISEVQYLREQSKQTHELQFNIRIGGGSVGISSLRLNRSSSEPCEGTSLSFIENGPVLPNNSQLQQQNYSAEAVIPEQSLIPKYEFNNRLVTIPQVFQEWKHGYDGGPSIEELDRKYKTKWRKGGAIQKRYSRRRALIKRIEEYAQNENISIKEAISLAE